MLDSGIDLHSYHPAAEDIVRVSQCDLFVFVGGESDEWVERVPAGNESRNYYACLISDATACCSQGIEFVPEKEMRYPDDFPKLGTTITVTGVFDTYMEGSQRYCQLLHAELVVS